MRTCSDVNREDPQDILLARRLFLQLMAFIIIRLHAGTISLRALLILAKAIYSVNISDH
jgi:hypothetical protein